MRLIGLAVVLALSLLLATVACRGGSRGTRGRRNRFCPAAASGEHAQSTALVSRITNGPRAWCGPHGPLNTLNGKQPWSVSDIPDE
jgi:hypothetical protein